MVESPDVGLWPRWLSQVGMIHPESDREVHGNRRGIDRQKALARCFKEGLAVRRKTADGAGCGEMLTQWCRGVLAEKISAAHNSANSLNGFEEPRNRSMQCSPPMFANCDENLVNCLSRSCKDSPPRRHQSLRPNHSVKPLSQVQR